MVTITLSKKYVKGQTMKQTNMRHGFTMIELIFVIVIIGILAVIAIPKLNATRDDAKVVTELQNLSTCLNDDGAAYTAQGAEDNTSSACKNLKCFQVGDSNTTDGNVTIVNNGPDAGVNYCNNPTDGAWARAVQKNTITNGAANANNYKIFGGSKIKM